MHYKHTSYNWVQRRMAMNSMPKQLSVIMPRNDNSIVCTWHHYDFGATDANCCCVDNCCWTLDCRISTTTEKISTTMHINYSVRLQGERNSTYLLFSNSKITETSGETGILIQAINPSIKYYFIVRPKVDQRVGQLCVPHIGITKTEKNRTKT